jgi:hypothetical protein
MSLNFDLREIPEETRTVIAEEDRPMDGIHKGDRIMSPVTNALIWSTMGLGIGVINDDTADEFAARLALWQKVNGALLHKPDPEGEGWIPVEVTKDDVLAHKGLSTNVFPMERRSSWLKRTIETSELFFGVTQPKYPRR